jgi:hypothetical protein
LADGSDGGTAIGQLIGDVYPTLAERRGALAHGDPFGGLATSGLIELVRHLINYAYRDYSCDGRALGAVTAFAPALKIEASHGEL